MCYIRCGIIKQFVVLFNFQTMKQDTFKSAEDIISDVVSITDPEVMQEHLRELIDTYLLSTEDSPKERDEVYATFSALSDALDAMKLYNPRKNQQS